MDLNEYQIIARTTAIYPDIGRSINYPTIGLCGETGEFAEKYKKVLRDDNGIISPEVKTAMVLELGDILWYIANIAYELNVDLDTVAKRNVEKLTSRVERDMISGSGDYR
ncbi:nucleoside triphosphate pyrophosphohydrolase family protein [Patescibacteria group bacterium]|nr:nucleoside triphosphate pyrophosphohydrolase family protein [Patescibacteria group bacterium]